MEFSPSSNDVGRSPGRSAFQTFFTAFCFNLVSVARTMGVYQINEKLVSSSHDPPPFSAWFKRYAMRVQPLGKWPVWLKPYAAAPFESSLACLVQTHARCACTDTTTQARGSSGRLLGGATQRAHEWIALGFGIARHRSLKETLGPRLACAKGECASTMPQGQASGTRMLIRRTRQRSRGELVETRGAMHGARATQQARVGISYARAGQRRPLRAVGF